ncbi:MAG: caspase family protein [Proteobacteria bacterium]|jgi:hypothetical protein|nr:caspase family protein [Pseudomonadota bacterium]
MPTVGKRHAVVVGVNNYDTDSGLGNLQYCANDAESLYDALLSYAQFDASNVVLFSDGSHKDAHRPSYSDILSAVEQACRLASEDDLVLFFFAGHGTRDDSDSYFLTSEYRANIVADSSISIQKLNSYFKQSKAKFKVRIFDACHSGRFARRGLVTPVSLEHLAVNAEGWASLAACKENQYSHELAEIGHGVFSYFLIRGLSGHASSDGKYVTLDDLKMYVLDKTIDLTTKRGLEQTPVFRGDQAGRLEFCLVGGPGATAPSPSVAKIVTSEPDKLAPSPAATPGFLKELAEIAEKDPPVSNFIYQSDKTRLEIATKLCEVSFETATKYACNELPRGHKLVAKKAVLKECILNDSLARYIKNSQIANLVDCEFIYKEVTRHKDEWETTEEPNWGLGGLGMFGSKTRTKRKVSVPYQEQELSEIVDKKGWPNSVTSIEYRPASRDYPFCNCTTAILPWAHGLYLAAYFATSVATKSMSDSWDTDSFSMRIFKAIPVEPIPWIQSEWETLFAQFVSFVVECTKARHMSIGKTLVLQTSKK